MKTLARRGPAARVPERPYRRLPVLLVAAALAAPPALAIPAAVALPAQAAPLPLLAQTPDELRSELDRGRALLESGDEDGARLHLRRALWGAIRVLEEAELHAAGAMGAAGSPDELEEVRPLIEAREHAAAFLEEALAVAVFRTRWGPAALDELREVYPRAPVFRRFAALLAVREGRGEEALSLYLELLRERPSDPEVHRERAHLLEALGRDEEALDGWTRLLELAPEDEESFRSLLRLHRDRDTLDELLEQIRRLSHRLPESRTLVEREVEVLHRMGRLDEAAEVARRLREEGP